MRYQNRSKASVVRDTSEGLMAKLVEEISAQRRVQEQQLAVARDHQRINRRWRIAGRAVLIGVPTLLGLVAYASAMGLRIGPIGEVVGVIHIDGEISASSQASADKIIPVLQEAFENRHVKQVVLAIDSPGGAPVEAERISQAIAALRVRHPKPVISAISNLGASAAYMIALHTDRIVAGKYSLVGSIGAVIAPWQLNRVMDKVGITQRVYASGRLKSFLNPFTPVTAEAEVKARDLVDRAGKAFLAELIQTRGSLLKPGIDYGTGEVWSGIEAKELGLIDAIGTVDDMTTARGMRSYNFGPYASAVGLLSRTMAEALVGRALEYVNNSSPPMR